MFDTREEMVEYYRKIYENNNNEVGDPSRINISFGARLIYLENDWIEEVLIRHLEKYSQNDVSIERNQLARKLISLAKKQRINLRHISEIDPINFLLTLLNGKKTNSKILCITLKCLIKISCLIQMIIINQKLTVLTNGFLAKKIAIFITKH